MTKHRLPEEVDLIAQIADLKETDYKNTLIVAALIELLIDKEVITRNDIIAKAQHLDADIEQQIREHFSPSEH